MKLEVRKMPDLPSEGYRYKGGEDEPEPKFQSEEAERVAWAWSQSSLLRELRELPQLEHEDGSPSDIQKRLLEASQQYVDNYLQETTSASIARGKAHEVLCTMLFGKYRHTKPGNKYNNENKDDKKATDDEAEAAANFAFRSIFQIDKEGYLKELRKAKGWR